jgi:hypothetical protein
MPYKKLTQKIIKNIIVIDILALKNLYVVFVKNTTIL